MNRLYTYLRILKLVFNSEKISDIDAKKAIKSSVKKGGHFIYEFMLRRYDYDISFIDNQKISNKCFIGKGHGAGSFDLYRKIKLKNGPILFEKIYFSSSVDFKKILIYKALHRIILERYLSVKIPIVYKIIESNKLSIVYFYFMYLEKLSSNDDEYMKKGSLIIYNLRSIKSINYSEIIIIDNKDKELLLYLNRFNLYTKYNSLDDIEKYFKSLPKQICHGDLNDRNLYHNALIDWDMMTIGHIGIDAGVLIAYHSYNKKRKDLFDFDLIFDKYFPFIKDSEKFAVVLYTYYYLIKRYKNNYKLVNTVNNILREILNKNQIL